MHLLNAVSSDDGIYLLVEMYLLYVLILDLIILGFYIITRIKKPRSSI